MGPARRRLAVLVALVRLALAAVLALTLAAPAAAAPRWQRIATTGPAPPVRYHHALAAVGDTVVLFGGATQGKPLGDTWVLDLARNRWRRLEIVGDSPSPRWGHEMAARPDGTVLLFGGQIQGVFYGDTWKLDVAARRWTKLSDGGPKARYGSASGFDPASGNLIVSHGFTDSGRFDDTWAVGGAAPAQLPTDAGARPERRCLVEGTVIGRAFYIFGGQSNPLPFRQDLWRLDLDTNRWTELKPARRPSPRNLYAAAAVGRRWYIHGGNTAKGLASGLWSFDTATGRFTPLAQSKARPGARRAHAAVSVAGGLVLFGGLTPTEAERADTWRLRV